MLVYVRALLDRLRGLGCEYEVAAEQCAKSNIEYRDCKRLYDNMEQERQLLLALVDYWQHSDQVPFEERELLSNAGVSLRKMRVHQS